MTGIEFRDPPPMLPGNRRTSKWQRIADQLRERPGEWAYVGEGSNGLPYAIKAGRIGAMPAGQFEATGRGLPKKPRRMDIYVRYVGPASLRKVG